MKKIVFSAIAAIISFLTAVVVVFGWFADLSTVELPKYSGSVYSSYFASGDGSKDNPYEINHPRHLYNLAWLQYNGYFNGVESEGKLEKQYYFIITADLDMSGYVLPPIGTVENPFMGNLEGGSHTISKLTVSNIKDAGEITKTPMNIKDMSASTSKAEIVGFFGVVGNVDLSGSTVATKYSATSFVPSVSNLFLDYIEVRTQTENSLIGLFAGYVCGNVKDIGVYHSKVTIGSAVNTLTGYMVHSNYALIGDYHKDSTGWQEVEGGAAGAGFGGSIDMKTLSRRVGYMITRIGQGNGLVKPTALASKAYNYQMTQVANTLYDARYSYQNLSATAAFNLNVYKNGNITDFTQSGFYYNSDYIKTEKGYTNKYLECGLLNKTYFPLNIDLEAMGLLNNVEITSTLSSSDNYSSTLYYNEQYSTCSSEKVAENNTGYIVGGAGADTSTNQAYVYLRISPLNYGYGTVSPYTAGQTIYKSLRYNLNLSSSTYSYSNSANSSSVAYTGTNLDLVTNVGGIFYRIVDSYNSTDTTSVVLSDLGTINSGSLMRYNSVRTQFGTMLEDNLIYGLKFKKTPSSSAKIVGTNVSINNTTYSSYELIKSAINFNLSQPGYMTAVFGGYDSNVYTQYGFNLYEVIRSEDKSTITSLNEITSVWTNASGDVKYNLGSSDDTTGYIKVYDSNWYNAVSGSDYGQIQPGNAYYVEIPLKAGDYCLGGADSSGFRNSAYLMYLDIGANGANSSQKTNAITSVKFVYNTGFYLTENNVKNLYTLAELFTFQIIHNKSSNAVEVYFYMNSTAMSYYRDVDAVNTMVTSYVNGAESTTKVSESADAKTNFSPPSST